MVSCIQNKETQRATKASSHHFYIMFALASSCEKIYKHQFGEFGNFALKCCRSSSANNMLRSVDGREVPMAANDLHQIRQLIRLNA